MMKRNLYIFISILMGGLLPGCALEVIDGCDSGMHSKNGYCVDDTTTECGDNAENCEEKPWWNTGKCMKGKCVYTSCATGYHTEKKGTCTQDTQKACGKDVVVCGSDQICKNGKCRTCADGKHVEDNECVDDVKDECEKCEQGQACCGRENFTCCEVGEFCLNDECASCGPGMKFDGRSCISENLEDAESCLDCTSDEVCVNGECTKCRTGLHADNGGCVPDTDTDCGRKGHACKETICRNGECEDCPIGEHFNNGICEQDSYTNCGKKGNICTNGICENGNCASCPTDMHAEEGVCVDDTLDNCGRQNNACHNQVCRNGSCVDCGAGEHFSNGNCVIDVSSGCGASEIDCDSILGWASSSCVNGVCVASSCDPGFCLLNGTCVDGRSSEHCGNVHACEVCDSSLVCENGSCVRGACAAGLCDHDNTCSNTNEKCGTSCDNCSNMPNTKVGLCVNGTCSADTCDKNYHRESDSSGNKRCVADTNSNCGENKTNCETGLCDNGTCLSLSATISPYTLACDAKGTLTLKLQNKPSTTVTVNIAIKDADGNVLTGSSYGIKAAKYSMSLTTSNWSGDNSITITGATSQNQPKKSYYKNAVIEMTMTQNGNTSKPITRSFNYYAFCNRSYAFTGDYEKVTLPEGNYLITVNGAGGGGKEAPGGSGGKAKGVLTLSSPTAAYVYVGGTGAKCTDSSCGGYNGGGVGKSGLYHGFGGGGATDVRLRGMANSYRVIVAGGGGGGFTALGSKTSSAGGDGGGSYGAHGAKDGERVSATPGGSSSGCRTTANLCVFGGPSAAPPAGKAGGGGGGWFSGAAGQADGTSGAGGSGYVFTGITTSYTNAGGRLDAIYAMKNAEYTLGGGAAQNENGSATIEVQPYP